MRILLAASHAIDRLNATVGRAVVWLVLVMVLISAGNALVRYGLRTSSNAWLEVQWYLFAAVFLLSAGATLLANGHVRIDVLSARLAPRTRLWIDLLGGLFFLLPVTLLILWLSWPMAVESLLRGEMSSDAGGLPRWPAKMLIPAGFLLLSLQGVSETIKRADALLRGDRRPLRARPRARTRPPGEGIHK